ncbi:MAG: cell division protein ZapA [Wenzhouxiangellaceae bacterium]|jgi:cell division protein ZapA|nr:cell division protein ZapA [Wenzhouxiangellaceae bacterium]MBS3747381.1 cell division protein ZapA [Wenzhouxiangellaceae bacterium]MBS3823882.1 cell division protein ZapA [Wenzhouxiangellaceae bacterium]
MTSEMVTVRILDREYQVMCAPEERKGLMEAALYLDSQMREVRESGKLSSVEKIAVMCALNFSDELLKLRQQSLEHGEQVDQRILDLAGRLEPADSGVVKS